MKTVIFNQTEKFESKVNFVDSNNVVLGYDMFQQCCEHVKWSICSDEYGNNPIHSSDESNKDKIELENYCFDPDYHKTFGYDDHNKAIFMLVGKDKTYPNLYVILENHHNGYYSHGFTFSGTENISDSL